MKTITRSLLLSLSMFFAVAATGCVEAVDTAPAAYEEDLAAVPVPAPPPPMCNAGSAPGGQMNMAGWTCEINPAGSNLCCDSNRGLICAGTGKPPFGTECVVLGNPVPIPIPAPDGTATPSDGDTATPSTDVRVEQPRSPA